MGLASPLAVRGFTVMGVLALVGPGCGGGLLDGPAAPAPTADAGSELDDVCSPGATRPCGLGLADDDGAAGCSGGTQTCEGEDEFGSWGTCEPDPQPAAELCSDGVDNDCDGVVDCDDEACLMEAACRAEYCSTGGTWAWPYLYYGCYPTGLAGRGVVDDTGAFWTDVGTFMARCAGHYQLCGRVQPNDGSCTVVEKCTEVDLATGGATVPLARLETWDDFSSCALLVHANGGLVCFVVRGTTSEGLPVEREKCIAYGSCGGGPCMGDACGGGGSTPGGDW